MLLIYCAPEMDDDAMMALAIIQDEIAKYEEQTHSLLGITRVIPHHETLASIKDVWVKKLQGGQTISGQNEVHIVALQSASGRFPNAHSRLYLSPEDDSDKRLYRAESIRGCDSWIALRPRANAPPIAQFGESIRNQHIKVVSSILGITLSKPRPWHESSDRENARRRRHEDRLSKMGIVSPHELLAYS